MNQFIKVLGTGDEHLLLNIATIETVVKVNDIMRKRIEDKHSPQGVYALDAAEDKTPEPTPHSKAQCIISTSSGQYLIEDSYEDVCGRILTATQQG